jgi:serine/threonine-protein kinase RsbW
MSTVCRFELENRLSEIDVLATRILQFCCENEVAENIQFDIRLVVEEAVTNIIKYGYSDQQVHRIEVKVELSSEKFCVEIEDDAQPFDPLQFPAPDLSLPIDQRPAGGLGIHLMRSTMDRMDYRSIGGKNILRMIKYTGSK